MIVNGYSLIRKNDSFILERFKVVPGFLKLPGNIFVMSPEPDWDVGNFKLQSDQWEEPDEVPRWAVDKVTVVDRINDAGKMTQLSAGLTSGGTYFRERWYAMHVIYSDDSVMSAFFDSIGADPTVILGQ